MKTKCFFIVFVITVICFNTLKSQWVQVADFPYDKLTDVFFINKDTGFVSGGNYADPDLCRTLDGGATWYTSSEDITGCIFALHFVNEQLGFLVSAQDLDAWIYRTTDLGQSWQQVYQMYLVSNDLSFPNANTGYAIQSMTENAMITKTTDGGSTWEVINSFWTEWGGYGVTDFQFITEDIGYMVYESGVAYRTDDGGLNFEQVYLDFNYNLRALFFLNADTGYMVGEKKDCFKKDSCGVVLKTTNGGQDWTVNALPGYGKDVAFLNADTGYIAADYIMLETIDAGESWQICEQVFDFYTMVSVQFPDQATGYAVGNWSSTSGFYKLDYYAGLDEAKSEEIKFSLLPNPARDYLTVDIFDDSHVEAISIYNQAGQIVLHTEKEYDIIDISHLEPGMYIIEALSDEWIGRERFIIGAGSH